MFAPRSGRTPKAALESTRKCFGRTETHRQSCGQNPRARLSREPHGGNLDTPTTQVVAEGFAHPCGEETVEMIRGKVCDISQGSENELLIQMLVNVCQHPMHSASVF